MDEILVMQTMNHTILIESGRKQPSIPQYGKPTSSHLQIVRQHQLEPPTVNVAGVLDYGTYNM